MLVKSIQEYAWLVKTKTFYKEADNSCYVYPVTTPTQVPHQLEIFLNALEFLLLNKTRLSFCDQKKKKKIRSF